VREGSSIDSDRFSFNSNSEITVYGFVRPTTLLAC